jgi:hypothetical protein
MDGDDDFFMAHQTDDFSDSFYAHAVDTPFLACIQSCTNFQVGTK